MSEPIRVSVLLVDLLAQMEAPIVRHPVVRVGERDPIPWSVRLSVARRDGYHCRLCGHHMPNMEGMELDHILPWSAGGADHSSNLRSLCRNCNQGRSNFNDGDHEREMAPTTWWCQSCWLSPDLEAERPDEYLDIDGPGQRRSRPAWMGNPRWVYDSSILAYCGWCWGYGYTDLAFTAELQPHLTTSFDPEEGETA